MDGNGLERDMRRGLVEVYRNLPDSINVWNCVESQISLRSEAVEGGRDLSQHLREHKGRQGKFEVENLTSNQGPVAGENSVMNAPPGQCR